MKRTLSLILCAVMLLGMASFATYAEPTDKAILFDDLRWSDVGSRGYAANAEPYTKTDEGVTLAFDFNAIQGVKCTHQFDKPGFAHLSAATVLIGSDGLQTCFVYDFDNKGFGLYGIPWPNSGANFDDGNGVKFAFAPFECKPGEWHRVVLNIWDVDVTVFVDGEIILEYSFLGGDAGNLAHDYLLWWPQHCRFAIDNIVISSPDPDEYDYLSTDYSNLDGAAGVFDWSDCNDTASYTYLGKEEYTYTDKEGKEAKATRELYTVTDKQKVNKETGELMTYEDGTPMYEEVGNMDVAKITFSDNKRSYTSVDRNGFINLTADAENAVLTFADVTGKRSKDITVEVTAADGADGTYTVSCHPYVSFKEVTNVASGATVKVDGDKVTISGAKAGKLCDFIFTTSEDVQQDDSYAVGLLSADKVVKAGRITIVNFKYGDCNDDGAVNAKDVSSMLKAKANWDTSKFPWNAEAADVYSDGNFNARDIQHLIRHLAGFGGIYAYIPSSSAPADVK